MIFQAISRIEVFLSPNVLLDVFTFVIWVQVLYYTISILPPGEIKEDGCN